MNRLAAQDLPQWLRKYRFPGGRVRGVRVSHSKDGTAIDFHITVREAIKDLGTEPKKVRLNLRLLGVEEYRLQMRPNQPKVKIADARIAYLSGLFYLSLDSLGLEPNERPQVHDFRVSELFAAGRELLWEEGEPVT
jgi:hypothetical protein